MSRLSGECRVDGRKISVFGNEVHRKPAPSERPQIVQVFVIMLLFSLTQSLTTFSSFA